MIAVDTNILLYAHRVESQDHLAAAEVVHGLSEGPDLWGLPVFVIGEFLRVATHPAVFQPPSTVAQAMDAIESLLDSPMMRILAPGDRYWRLFAESIVDSGARGNLVFDAQIVAVCREHGVDTILSQDRDFRRFSNIRVQRLP